MLKAGGRVVVCGAGVMGAAVACFLAERGAEVTVVERSGVACAASGKAGGFLALDWCDGSPLGPLARLSFGLHAELARRLGVDYGYRRVDTFALAARERGEVRGRHRVEAPGWIDGAGVVTAVIGSTETTAQVHPGRFTTALLDAARARGTRLRMGAVEGLVRSNGTGDGDGPQGGVARGGLARGGGSREGGRPNGAVVGVRVDGETLPAAAVVLAMGPWTALAVKDVPLPRISGLKGHSVTLAGASVPAHALFVEYRTADGRHLEPEVFPRPDGEVYVCGMADPTPLPLTPDGVEVSDAACAVLAGAAGRVSSALARARIERRQACYRPVCDDGLPLIGAVPGVPGAYVATGHGPWGILNAPATGLALAELITTGAASSVDLRPFDPARLPALQAGGR